MLLQTPLQALKSEDLDEIFMSWCTIVRECSLMAIAEFSFSLCAASGVFMSLICIYITSEIWFEASQAYSTYLSYVFFFSFFLMARLALSIHSVL